MKRSYLILVGLILGVASTGLARQNGKMHGSPRPSFVRDEIIVKFKSSSSSTFKNQMVSTLGHKKMATLGSEDFWHIKLSPGETVDQALSKYQNDPAVEFAQPNIVYHALGVPNDTYFNQQWSLQNSGQTITATNSFDPVDPNNNPGIAGKDMSLPAAWDLVTDCHLVTVAVVDTGINYNHQDLAANMWIGEIGVYPHFGYDFITNTNDPMDKNGHGTHVAGTIGAVGNNAFGTAGICWKAQLMAVRVLDASGSGTTAQVVQGINFAVNNGANVINMSLGASTNDPTMQTAIANANTKGVAVVVAAGNAGSNNDTTPTYPCSYNLPNMICVAALDQAFGLASFSNYGATTVHVGAPGTNILSTWAGTQTTVADTFNTGGVLNWTATTSTTGGWGYGKRTFTVGGVPTAFDVLFDPNNWDGATKTYNKNTDDRVYKTFNMAGAASLNVSFQAFVDTTLNQDFFNVFYKASGGSPFTGGVQLDSLSGPGNGSSQFLSYDVTPCATATCSIGFQLTSGNTPRTGIGILEYAFTKLTLDNTHYNIIEGTSMATPHVTGLVALVMAFNPSYTAAEAIAAVKNGGVAVPALAGKTSTGKGVNALGSLTYINPPTGVVAVKQ